VDTYDSRDHAHIFKSTNTGNNFTEITGDIYSYMIPKVHGSDFRTLAVVRSSRNTNIIYMEVAPMLKKDHVLFGEVAKKNAPTVVSNYLKKFK